MDSFVKAVASQGVNRLIIANHHFREFLNAIDAGGREETVNALKNLKILSNRGGFVRNIDVCMTQVFNYFITACV